MVNSGGIRHELVLVSFVGASGGKKLVKLLKIVNT